MQDYLFVRGPPWQGTPCGQEHSLPRGRHHPTLRTWGCFSGLGCTCGSRLVCSPPSTSPTKPVEIWGGVMRMAGGADDGHPKWAVIRHLIPPSQGLGAVSSKHAQRDTVSSARGLPSCFIDSPPLSGKHSLKLQDPEIMDCQQQWCLSCRSPHPSHRCEPRASGEAPTRPSCRVAARKPRGQGRHWARGLPGHRTSGDLRWQDWGRSQLGPSTPGQKRSLRRGDRKKGQEAPGPCPQGRGPLSSTTCSASSAWGQRHPWDTATPHCGEKNGHKLI